MKMDSNRKVMLILNNSTDIVFKALYIFQSLWSSFLSNLINYSGKTWEGF